MNSLHEHETQQARPGRLRSGLSIIEVLTSVVVAMIGVFGVMILIPFAVKQAQSGLDSDAAVLLGRNAYSQFEIAGFRSPSNWAVFLGSGLERRYSPFENWDADGDGTAESPPMPPGVLSIDPLGISESDLIQGHPIGKAYVKSVFPYKRLELGSPYPPDLQISPANLWAPTGSTMADSNLDGAVDEAGRAMARRVFRASDDLVFGESVDELLGPEQFFDQGGTGVLRRQSVGRLSWSAIVVPFKPDRTSTKSRRWSYKMYILVYKNRNTQANDPDGRMVTAKLEPTRNVGVQSPVTNIYFEPGVYVEPTTTASGVVRDDWVMLINRNKTVEVGFDRQIAFYRVVDVANGIGVPNKADLSTLSSMTLDGPDFNFGTPAITSPGSVIGETFAIHLKDVVGVYERTFEPEYESTWN